MVNPRFCLLLARTLVIVLFSRAFTKVGCLNFTYPTFLDENENVLIRKNSMITFNAIQVTPDLSDPKRLMNQSGRSLYIEPLRLWRKGKGKKIVTTSFNTTFMLNISPYPTSYYPFGEGLSFILAADPSLPNGSQGKWLGIANDSTNGSMSRARVVAVEFDTRKSFPEDVDDNHVGLNLNSVNSIKQVSLTDYGVNLSSGSNITVQIQYDGMNISVFVSPTNDVKSLVLTWPLNLSDHLPEKVYVGFSGSTGENNTERNCILSWQFHSLNIDEKQSLLWGRITVPIAVVVLIGIACCLYWKRPCCKNDLERTYPRIEDQIQGSSMSPKKFHLKELRRATNNFDLKNKLGKGGFGTVFKGIVGDRVVAVKRVSKDSRQGQQEFISEVTTIGSLSHRNLVKLIGWCYESHELLIVYEFMPNGSLDRFIFRDETLGMEIPDLSWKRRLSIICGVAQALDYLHNDCTNRVLHRDIKSSNIMLDSEFNAKLGDFGLARIIQQSEKTHHTTREIAGTPGYMAPESFLTGRATVETDVYAFGVLILEVVSGRKPGSQNEENSFTNGMVLWIWGLYSNGMILNAVDPRLNEELEDDEVGCTLLLGLACCHPNPNERPSMTTILKVLKGEEEPPMVPAEVPAFVWPSMPASFKEDGETTRQGGPFTLFTEITGR
ncbi:probable L-type lectin-domain containing receptor kinase S.5 [Humulus lupulus]|uniref:probable L-type lectin-domain containing receptor kinase S.5 n=1 Tax=Humulus lupulus TaxID=3486 RepID=UPI002B40AE85|nr:probable L-type lectin-domain containing receptor kinase S.5 [Humulus lupulus]